MKKLILSLLLLCGLAATTFAQAPTETIVMTGQLTNRATFYIGTNTSPISVLNRLTSTTGFSTGGSNLAAIVTNQIIQSTPATSVGLVTAAFTAASAATNDYYLQRAYRREGPWEPWTNVSFAMVTGQNWTNYNLTLGNYLYFKVSDVTNRLSAVTSNYLSFHQKAQ